MSISQSRLHFLDIRVILADRSTACALSERGWIVKSLRLA